MRQFISELWMCRKFDSIHCDSNATRKRYIAEAILARKPKTVGIYRLIHFEGGSDSASCRAGVMQHLMKRGRG